MNSGLPGTRPGPPRTGHGTIRRTGHVARTELARHLLRLKPYQRCMRFNGNDDFVRAYCHGFTGTRPVTLGYFMDGILRGAGEMFILSDIAARRNCEVAVSVEGEHQGRGIGTSLVTRLLVLASNRRIPTMHALYVHGNKRMENIALRFGARITSDGSQAEAIIDVPAPSEPTASMRPPLFAEENRTP
jgi:RimJ/RimL family protein N-acetyltransferase